MHRLIKITLTTMVVIAGIISAASAQTYVSPAARDAAPQWSPGNDLRSPDARDSARHVSTVTDLRSPDARDSARHSSPVTDLPSYGPGRAPTVQAQQPVLQVPSGGFNWGDAGIGAAGMLALIALIAGTLTIVSHRRRGPLATS
jgi:hypothetical protein